MSRFVGFCFFSAWMLLLAGCGESVDERHQEAINLTSEAQTAIRAAEFDKARQLIDKAIAIEPTPDRFRMRAETHLEDLPAALADVEEGLKIEPYNGRLLKLKQTLEEALKNKRAPTKTT